MHTFFRLSLLHHHTQYFQATPKMPESDRENDSRDRHMEHKSSRDSKSRSDHDKHSSSRSSRSSRSHSDRSDRHRSDRSERSDRSRSDRHRSSRSSRDRSRSRESRRSDRSRRDRRDRSRDGERRRRDRSRESRKSRDEKPKLAASGQWVVDESDEESRDVKEGSTPHVTTRNDDINTLNQQIAGDLRKKLLEKKSDHVTAESEDEETETAESAGKSVTLSAMDTQMMHTKAPSNPEDMTIAEMLAEERRLSHMGNASSRAAETISRDKGFSTDESYADDNSSRLASMVSKKQIDLKNMAVSQVQKMTKVLDNCALCAEDRAPKTSVISTGTRVYLSISATPELASFSCAIVPIAHHKNTLSCDSDEWEEIRNFQKCLAVMFHSLKKGVCFYENAARPWEYPHAHIVCVPVPLELTNDINPFFQEAFLTSDTEWSQHRKVITTSGKGKLGFQTSIAKEAPYVHVWTTIDGGLGHIVEDEKMWPSGDRFCREVLAGLLRCPPELAKRRVEWVEDKEKRARFVEKWSAYDWTRQLSGERSEPET